MKKFFSTFFIIGLLMFFAWVGESNAQTYSVGTPTITIGNVTLPLSRAIILTGGGSVNARYDTLRVNGSQYQVSSGKTLYIVAYKCYAISAAAAGFTQIGYGDTAVTDSVATPTNSVNRQMNGANTANSVSVATIGSIVEGSLYVTAIAGKYPYILNQNIPACTFMGYES